MDRRHQLFRLGKNRAPRARFAACETRRPRHHQTTAERPEGGQQEGHHRAEGLERSGGNTGAASCADCAWTCPAASHTCSSAARPSVGPERRDALSRRFPRPALAHGITTSPGLLASEGATWHDMVRTTCYIRDIERDYGEFNSIRNEFFHALGLNPFPGQHRHPGPDLPGVICWWKSKPLPF